MVACLGMGARAMSTQQVPSASDESLIPTTLAEMAADMGDSQGVELTAKLLRQQGQVRLTREEKKRRRRALDAIGVPDFAPFLEEKGVQEWSPLR